MELAAIVFALVVPKPLHIATDSQAVQRKASRLIGAARTMLRSEDGDYALRPPGMKPWNLQVDGDLWELFRNAVVLRGPDTVDVKKTNVHVSLYNRIGSCKFSKFPVL